LTSTVHSLAKGLLGLIYPVRCGGCGSNGNILCRQCTNTFRFVEETSSCPICGRLVGHRIVCGQCLDKKKPFEEGFYGFYYEKRLRDAIHSFKFSGRKDVGKCLVHLVRTKMDTFSGRFDCIVPVPVTEKRLRERGFNQSFIIAEEISGITGKPVCHGVLQKTKETKDQYALSKDERKRNIKGAFSLKRVDTIRGKRVLLIDDLYTTGQTAREASRTLAKGKTKAVLFFALARTP